MKRRASVFAAMWLVGLLLSTAAHADGDVRLGPAPQLTKMPPSAVAPAGQITAAPVAPIDTQSLGAVVAAYQNTYLPDQSVPAQWTGSVDGCVAGATSLAYEEATLRRINYYRAMSGLPGDVVFDSDQSVKCQDAALMMIANGQLSHFPPPGWTCYTAAGAEAAGNSNLALGAAGPAAVDLYMNDPGAGNEILGHRRWILYPRQTAMGAGSVTAASGSFSGANVLWVLGPFGTRPPAPEWVAWPPAGYVPYSLVFARWSFSYPSANFAGATVEVTSGTTSLPVSIISATDVGYGDNTIAFVPANIPSRTTPPTANETYAVRIANVIVSGSPREFTYAVTRIDPSQPVRTQSARWQFYF